MLSKISVPVFRALSKQPTACFGVDLNLKRRVFDAVYTDDKSDVHFKAATADPRRPLPSHQSQQFTEQPANFEVTKLSNGITVLTESQSFPGPVDIGILLDVGTRDETPETSGSLLSIKNSYLKTMLNTNETINYGIVQMSGGKFEMKYDQENAYFHATSLAQDTVDMFNMVADCALEPRSVVAANVSINKGHETHKLDSRLQTGEAFNDTVFRTAYGLKGLGMPLKGLKGNVDNLTAFVLQKFQLDNINPERIFISASNVESHQEFVDLVSQKLGSLPSAAGQSVVARENAEYLGGEVRNLNDSGVLNLAFGFQGVNWTNDQLYPLLVAQSLLNNSIIPNQITNKHHFVDAAEALNFNFSDSGFFGFRIAGAGSNAK